MAINVINKTSYDTELLTRFLSLAVSHHESKHFYDVREAGVEYTLVASSFGLEKEWSSFYKLKPKNQKAKNLLLNCYHSFLMPLAKSEVLRILLVVKPEHLQGISRYFSEVAGGSQARTPGTDQEKKEILFMSAFDLLESILYEYTHLCTCECFMRSQGWDKTELFADLDVTLHDEYISNYLAFRLALEILGPYMEPSFFFRLFSGYFESAGKSLQKEGKDTLAFLKEGREELKQLQSTLGISDRAFTHYLEHELGHHVSRKGPSDLDIAECFSSGPMEQIDKRFSYQFNNPLACQSGAPLMGILQAFYEAGHSLFLGERSFLPPEKLRLENVFQKPFVEYVSVDDFQRLQTGIKSLMERFPEE